MWNLIAEMRKENIAPVDTMGCSKLADPNATENEKNYHSLIGLMLSAQTKDEVTAATTRFLI